VLLAVLGSEIVAYLVGAEGFMTFQSSREVFVRTKRMKFRRRMFVTV
jgi:hypothetical protein